MGNAIYLLRVLLPALCPGGIPTANVSPEESFRKNSEISPHSPLSPAPNMKLHLPKQLFTALIAAIACVQTVNATITTDSQQIQVGDTTYNATVVTGSANNGLVLDNTVGTGGSISDGKTVNTRLNEGDTILGFQMKLGTATDANNTNWFDGTQTYAGDILVMKDSSVTDGYSGLVINNGNGGNVITFSGKVIGDGDIAKTSGAPSNGVDFKFTGDMSDYTGNMYLTGNANDDLLFDGSTSQNMKTGTGTITSVGNITFTDTEIYNSSISVTTDSKSITFNGSNTIKSSRLTISGSATNNGTLTVEDDGVLSISSSIVNNNSLTFETGSKLVVSSLEDLTFETTGIDYTAESNSMQHVGTTYHVYSGTGSATGLNQVYIGSTEGDICDVNDDGTISVTENAYVITTGTVTVGGASQSSELSGDIDYFAVGANGTLNIEGSYGELTTGTILATAVGSGVLNLNTDASMVNTLASAYTGSVNINTGVTLQANEYAQLSSATSIAVKKGAVLDFSSNNNGVLTVEFLKTLNSASNLTTEEGGWIKVAGANIGNDFVTEKDTDGYTLDKNFHVAGDLRFNGRGYENGSSYRLKIGSKALKVDGTLKLESKAYLDIEGGSAEISTLLLGHNEQGNPGGLTMNSGSLQLGTIQFNNANNQTTTLNTVDISGGNLEFKTSNAITLPFFLIFNQ